MPAPSSMCLRIDSSVAESVLRQGVVAGPRGGCSLISGSTERQPKLGCTVISLAPSQPTATASQPE